MLNVVVSKSVAVVGVYSEHNNRSARINPAYCTRAETSKLNLLG